MITFLVACPDGKSDPVAAHSWQIDRSTGTLTLYDADLAIVRAYRRGEWLELSITVSQTKA